MRHLLFVLSIGLSQLAFAGSYTENCTWSAKRHGFGVNDAELLCENAESYAPITCAKTALNLKTSYPDAARLCANADTANPIACAYRALGMGFSYPDMTSLCTSNDQTTAVDCANEALNLGFSYPSAKILCQDAVDFSPISCANDLLFNQHQGYPTTAVKCSVNNPDHGAYSGSFHCRSSDCERKAKDWGWGERDAKILCSGATSMAPIQCGNDLRHLGVSYPDSARICASQGYENPVSCVYQALSLGFSYPDTTALCRGRYDNTTPVQCAVEALNLRTQWGDGFSYPDARLLCQGAQSMEPIHCAYRELANGAGYPTTARNCSGRF